MVSYADKGAGSAAAKILTDDIGGNKIENEIIAHMEFIKSCGKTIMTRDIELLLAKHQVLKKRNSVPNNMAWYYSTER